MGASSSLSPEVSGYMADLGRRSVTKRKVNAVTRRIAELPPLTEALRQELHDAVEAVAALEDGER